MFEPPQKHVAADFVNPLQMLHTLFNKDPQRHVIQETIRIEKVRLTR